MRCTDVNVCHNEISPLLAGSTLLCDTHWLLQHRSVYPSANTVEDMLALLQDPPCTLINGIGITDASRTRTDRRCIQIEQRHFKRLLEHGFDENNAGVYARDMVEWALIYWPINEVYKGCTNFLSCRTIASDELRTFAAEAAFTKARANRYEIHYADTGRYIYERLYPQKLTVPSFSGSHVAHYIFGEDDVLVSSSWHSPEDSCADCLEAGG